jgi:hypothetical protein
MVWDRHVHDSLIATTRAKRGNGMCRRVVGSAHIPINWQNFLRVDENKKKLFDFISRSVVNAFMEEDKEIIATIGKEVLCVQKRNDLVSLVPGSHEEGDTRLLLHATACKNNHQLHSYALWTLMS